MVEQDMRGTILDPNGTLPAKRKHVWVQRPIMYDIDACPKCGGQNTTWSEYVDHIWCYDCGIDYVPECFGIFDGPIPVGVVEMFGTKLSRVNIETGKVYNHTDPEFNTTWP